MANSAVITAMGCVSPYGAGVPLFWTSLQAGKSAFSPISFFDASSCRNHLAGEVPWGASTTDDPRALQFLREATREATQGACLDRVSPDRIGISLGTNFGTPQCGLDAFRTIPSGHCNLQKATLGAGLNAVRTVLPAEGPSTVLSLACASGTAAIGSALNMIRQGDADVMIAGGFDELSLQTYMGLNNLRAISKEGIFPFHAKRSGTLFAEGAGILVLERVDHALARGAPILARLEGWAVNNDAFHMTAPDKSGEGIAAVMTAALEDCRRHPSTVDHINCHGTGTVYNDLIETLAIKHVFPDARSQLILTANKSCFGHAMGAAGALEAISTVKSLITGIIPPTLGLDEVDPALDLDYCPMIFRCRPIQTAMSNSYGLGGTNASILLSRMT